MHETGELDTMKTSAFDLDLVIKRGKIESELELEQALFVDRQLRLLAKVDPSLKKKRTKLREIIGDYESKKWTLDSKVTKRQIEESNEAENIVEEEGEFYQKRKELIKSKLSKLNLNQQEFGIILGHTSKSYMSELMNGVSPFSLKDLILISRLLKIDLEDLVFTTISLEERKKIERSIRKLDKPKLKLNPNEFALW